MRSRDVPPRGRVPDHHPAQGGLRSWEHRHRSAWPQDCLFSGVPGRWVRPGLWMNARARQGTPGRHDHQTDRARTDVAADHWPEQRFERLTNDHEPFDGRPQLRYTFRGHRVRHDHVHRPPPPAASAARVGTAGRTARGGRPHGHLSGVPDHLDLPGAPPLPTRLAARGRRQPDLAPHPRPRPEPESKPEPEREPWCGVVHLSPQLRSPVVDSRWTASPSARSSPASPPTGTASPRPARRRHLAQTAPSNSVTSALVAHLQGPRGCCRKHGRTRPRAGISRSCGLGNGSSRGILSGRWAHSELLAPSSARRTTVESTS